MSGKGFRLGNQRSLRLVRQGKRPIAAEPDPEFFELPNDPDLLSEVRWPLKYRKPGQPQTSRLMTLPPETKNSTGLGTSRIPRGLLIVLMAVLGSLSLASLVRGSANALGWTTVGLSRDLSSYWSTAQVLIEGENPYRAVLETSPSIRPPASVLEKAPTHRPYPMAAPLQLLLLSPLAALSWKTATLIFLTLNLGAALVLPFLLFRTVTAVPKTGALLLALWFWGMLPTRNAISNGQSTVLVLLFLFLAVRLAKRSPVFSGALLALGLAKYSIGLPVLAWFAICGAWLPLLVAGSLHLGALVSMAAVTSSSPVGLLLEYILMVRRYLPPVGDIDLPGWILRAGGPEGLAAALTGIGALAASGLLLGWLRWRQTADPATRGKTSAAAIALFGYLVVTSLPFVYHRGYDALVLIIVPYVALAVNDGCEHEAAWPFLALLDRYSFELAMVILAVFLLPRQSLAARSAVWEPVLLFGSTLATFGLWLLSARLLWRTSGRCTGDSTAAVSPEY